jgi:hypothetical protein
LLLVRGILSSDAVYLVSPQADARGAAALTAGVDAATTGWMLAVSAIFSTSALALLLVIGALAGSASLAGG